MLFFVASLLSMQVCDKGSLPTRAKDDTTLFVYENPKTKTSLKQHGDTVWRVSNGETMRMVDDGRSISLLTVVKGDSTIRNFCVVGDRAYPLPRRDSDVSVSVKQLRSLQDVVASAKRLSARMRDGTF